MQIKRDLFLIESGVREADGTKLEPEQQAVQHVFQGSTSVGLGAGLDIVEPGAQGIGQIPLEIVAHSDAKAVARSVSALCSNCRWWDQAGWQKMIANADNPGSSPAEKHSVNEIRMQLLLNMPNADDHVGSDGDYDVEHAMKAMGLCPALREFYKGKDGIDEPHGTFALSGCPAETCSPDKPFGLFVPRDGDARKASAANFDAVMLRAAGRIA